MRYRGSVYLFLFFFSLKVSFAYEPDDVLYNDCSVEQEVRADCKKIVPKEKAKNVVLMIGDGMGLNQVYITRVYKNGKDKPLVLETLPYRSLIKTCSLTGVTDSAASGTAFATGYKTKNAHIATDSKGERLVTILEMAQKEGKSTGLITTDSTLGATPSSFGTHSGSRYTFESIALSYLETKPNLVLGGGSKIWESKARGKSLIQRAEQAGYLVVKDRGALLDLSSKTNSFILGIFAPVEMSYEIDRREGSREPHLSEMADFALNFLSQDPDGFFLLVEGGRIDHACHSTDTMRMIEEVYEFDRAVSIVLEWQKGHSDTLVLISSDHETGGIEVEKKDYKKGDVAEFKWTTKKLPLIPASHSSQQVALYGIGPGAEEVEKVKDNSEVFCLMKNAFGFASFEERKRECPCER